MEHSHNALLQFSGNRNDSKTLTSIVQQAGGSVDITYRNGVNHAVVAYGVTLPEPIDARSRLLSDLRQHPWLGDIHYGGDPKEREIKSLFDAAVLGWYEALQQRDDPKVKVFVKGSFQYDATQDRDFQARVYAAEGRIMESSGVQQPVHYILDLPVRAAKDVVRHLIVKRAYIGREVPESTVRGYNLDSFKHAARLFNALLKSDKVVELTPKEEWDKLFSLMHRAADH